MDFKQSFLNNICDNLKLFELAKIEGNKKNYINSFKCAEQIILNNDEDITFGIFIILKVKKQQNILLNNDADKFFHLLLSCKKINNTHETKVCINIINKLLLSQRRPKVKKIILLSYSEASKKILDQSLPFNFSFVDESLAGSAIVKVIHIKLLYDLKFTTIINLTETNHSQEFIDVCKTFNINVYHFPIVDREATDLYTLNKILKIIEQTSKTLVHCIGGIGRTNMILASYLIKKQSLSLSEAVTILDTNRKIILTSEQNLFVKDFYRICNTPKNFDAILKVHKTLLPNLIILIGCPCSGKTTFALELLRHYDEFIHINQDELGKKECENVFSLKCKHYNIILDRCNITKKERLEWLKSYKQLIDGKIYAIHFDINIEICKNRIKNRINHPTLQSSARSIKIIEDIYKRIEIPNKKDEGYDELIIINNDYDLLLLRNRFGYDLSPNNYNTTVTTTNSTTTNNIMKFPRTKHLFNLGSMSNDDKIFNNNELNVILALDVTIEEKIDGANLGIFYDSDLKRIIIQNRSHYVSSIYHIQFKLLDKWIDHHKTQLMNIFSMGNYIIFGEWLYMKHSIHYTKLPDYFIAYDIYDRINNIFLERSKLINLLENTNINIVRIIYQGKVNVDQLKSLVNSKSIYYDGLVEGIYIRAFHNNIVKYRGKIVRSDFICGDEKHWIKKKYTFNCLLK